MEELKSNVRVLLLGRAGVEPGRFTAKLEKYPGRHIPWKQCVLENLGIDVAEEFRKKFRVHIRFEVRVIEYAVPPMWRGHEDSWNSEN